MFDTKDLAGGLSAVDQRLPLFARISEALRSRIGSQEWTPGDTIPPEIELARLYGVSLGTMRRAIEALVTQGLLERRQGSGTFVRRPEIKGFPLRFFRFEDTQTGERIVPESRVFSVNAVEPPGEAAAALNIERGALAINIVRLRSWKSEPVLFERIFLPFDRFERLLSIPIPEIGVLLYPFYEKSAGVIIGSATDDLTISESDEEIAGLLHTKAGAPVVVIERVARDIKGLPVEWRRSWGRGDRFRYRVEAR